MPQDPLAKIEDLKQLAQSLPPAPGVYLMKDKKDQVIYVGKAKNLPRRVSSYFQKTPSSVRIGLMVAQINSFDFVVTNNEKESLILENSLIKKYRPKYNVILRDDKTYPSLRLSTQEDFPRLEVVRRPVKDGSVIFGPFPSPGAMRETMRLILGLFPLRQCRRPEVKKIDRPCLNYQMGRCIGPCRPEVTPEEYKKLCNEVRLFFRGRQDDLIRSLNQDMKKAAENEEFEEAAKIRDRLANIKKTLERQIISQVDDRDQDVFGLYQEGGLYQAAILFLRSGTVVGCLPLEISGSEELGSEAEIIASLVSQHYSSGNFIPDEIYLPCEINFEEKELLEDWLLGQKKKSVKIMVPQRGDRVKLLELAQENAKVALAERLKKQNQTGGVLVEIQARLGLAKIPRRLECFDLAHFQGESAAAGMVVMVEGEWKKAHYRRFKIKLAKGGDDYAGMKEVIGRRYAHEEWPAPDLLLIDGGRGQLAAALSAFKDLGINPPPIAAIAEARAAEEIDRIFIPGRKNPVDLKKGSPGLLLLSRLRDEAHRYVRSYHHLMQTKKITESPLLKIPGLGPIKHKKLLNNFSSLKNLAQATDEEILKVVKLSPEALDELRHFLSPYLK